MCNHRCICRPLSLPLVIFHIGRQAVNTYIQAFDNVVQTHEGGTWIMLLQVQLLFPR